MVMPVTLVFAAAAALLNLWLGIRIARVRMAEQVLHGDGGSSLLMKRMRAQANFVEYTPFLLVLAGVVEMALGSTMWLWIAVAAYIFGRIAHAFGMDSDQPAKTRMIGIMVTFTVTIVLTVAALYAAYAGLTRAVAVDMV
nr:MAPEG family protein [Sphingobium algorifonticola]